ncbi:hypothetical protein [Streptomyces sp. NPDC014793]|uniref:hypothetical protein n=1 Tax=Streptomyces sp. NPDC014793 TaxID=3364914 RepID=UPI0037015BB2
MSIDFLPADFSRITVVDVVVPVSDKPDLLDPSTGRTIIPAFVEVSLRRNQGVPTGDRESAYVSVAGPRRLKSGAAGKQISCYGWDQARNRGARHVVERPDWLSLVIFDLWPGGWPLSLVELTTPEPVR